MLSSVGAAAVVAAALLLLAPAATPVDGAPRSEQVSAARPADRAWVWPITGEPQVLRPFAAPEHRWSAGHRGVDLAASPGDAVLAPASGVVAFAGRVVDRPVVSIATPGGLRVTMEPVDAAVARGTPVRAGDRVGALAAAPGHCGAATCLHWGVRAGRDRYLDPLAVLTRGSRPAPPVLLPQG